MARSRPQGIDPLVKRLLPEFSNREDIEVEEVYRLSNTKLPLILKKLMGVREEDGALKLGLGLHMRRQGLEIYGRGRLRKGGVQGTPIGMLVSGASIKRYKACLYLVTFEQLNGEIVNLETNLVDLLRPYIE